VSTRDDDNLDWSHLIGPGGPAAEQKPGPPVLGARTHPWFDRGPRPGEVTTAAVVAIIVGVLRAGLSVWVMAEYLSLTYDVPGWLVALSILDIALALILVGAGFGVLRGSDGARLAAITVSVINAFAGVVSLILGAGFLVVVGIAVNVGVIALMNRYYVKEWCR
jgi:hypothetical protein